MNWGRTAPAGTAKRNRKAPAPAPAAELPKEVATVEIELRDGTVLLFDADRMDDFAAGRTAAGELAADDMAASAMSIEVYLHGDRRRAFHAGWLFRRQQEGS